MIEIPPQNFLNFIDKFGLKIFEKALSIQICRWPIVHRVGHSQMTYTNTIGFGRKSKIYVSLTVQILLTFFNLFIKFIFEKTLQNAIGKFENSR